MRVHLLATALLAQLLVAAHAQQEEKKLILDADGIPEHEPAHYTLGFGSGYGVEQLCMFISSWERFDSAYGGRLVVFVTPEAAPVLRAAFPGPSFHAVAPFEEMALRHRHRVYLEYIRPRLHLMLGILLADLRDAFFNAPFWSAPSPAFAVQHNLAVFVMEGNLLPGGRQMFVHIPDEPTNTNWYRECYDNATLAALGRAAISCAGTTYGSGMAIMRYVEAMIRQMAKTPASCIDQAVHNHLLHKIVLPGRSKYFRGVAHGQGVSAVYTALFGFPIDVDPYGIVRIRRTDRTTNTTAVFTPPLVHQLDRHDDALAAVRATRGVCVPPMRFNASWVDGDAPGA